MACLSLSFLSYVVLLSKAFVCYESLICGGLHSDIPGLGLGHWSEIDGVERMGAMDARNSTLLHPRSCLTGKQKEIKSGAKNLPLGAMDVQ